MTKFVFQVLVVGLLVWGTTASQGVGAERSAVAVYENIPCPPACPDKNPPLTPNRIVSDFPIDEVQIKF